jgi:hypothetical protein
MSEWLRIPYVVRGLLRDPVLAPTAIRGSGARISRGGRWPGRRVGAAVLRAFGAVWRNGGGWDHVHAGADGAGGDCTAGPARRAAGTDPMTALRED